MDWLLVGTLTAFISSCKSYMYLYAAYVKYGSYMSSGRLRYM